MCASKTLDVMTIRAYVHILYFIFHLNLVIMVSALMQLQFWIVIFSNSFSFFIFNFKTNYFFFFSKKKKLTISFHAFRYPSDLFTRAKINSVLDWHHSNLRRGSGLNTCLPNYAPNVLVFGYIWSCFSFSLHWAGNKSYLWIDKILFRQIIPWRTYVQ